MDIHKLKNAANEMRVEQEKIELMKVLAIEKFEDFVEICGELNKLTTKEVATKKLELVREFREFFASNGFLVENVKLGKYKATHEGNTVILEDENPNDYENESIISFQVPTQQKYDAIVIKAEEKNEAKLYWKNNLKFNHEHVGFENSREIINSIGEQQELEKLTDKINENIEWYRDTINNFSDLKFIYSIYKTDLEFGTFKELFEAI